MKNFKVLTTFILVFILILGIALFFFRSEALNYVNGRAGISGTDLSSVRSNVDASEAIDLSVLKSDKLDNLSNKVTSFDYDTVCRRPSSLIKPATGASSTASVQSGCSVGNYEPFVSKKKE